MKQYLKILWFKFWAAVAGGLYPGFVVHSYLSLSQIKIEKDLLSGLYVPFIPFGDRRNLNKIYVHMVGQGQ